MKFFLLIPIFSALIFSSCSEEEKNNSSDNTVMPWDFKLRQECADKGSYWVNGICQEDAFDWSNETCYIDGSSYSGIICKEVESCYDYEDEWNHDTKTCIKALRVTSLNNSTPKFTTGLDKDQVADEYLVEGLSKDEEIISTIVTDSSWSNHKCAKYVTETSLSSIMINLKNFVKKDYYNQCSLNLEFNTSTGRSIEHTVEFNLEERSLDLELSKMTKFLMNGQKQRLGKATITWDGDQMPSIRFAEQCKGASLGPVVKKDSVIDTYEANIYYKPSADKYCPFEIEAYIEDSSYSKFRESAFEKGESIFEVVLSTTMEKVVMLDKNEKKIDFSIVTNHPHAMLSTAFKHIKKRTESCKELDVKVLENSIYLSHARNMNTKLKLDDLCKLDFEVKIGEEIFVNEILVDILAPELKTDVSVPFTNDDTNALVYVGEEFQSFSKIKMNYASGSFLETAKSFDIHETKGCSDADFRIDTLDSERFYLLVKKATASKADEKCSITVQGKSEIKDDNNKKHVFLTSKIVINLTFEENPNIEPVVTLKDLDEGKTYKLDHLSPTEPIVIEIPKRRNKFQLHFQSGSSETRIKNAYLVVKSKQEDPKCTRFLEKKP